MKLLSEPYGARSVKWILETATDADMIVAAVRMVPGVGWPAEDDMHRLENHLYGCYDPILQLIPSTQSQVATCLRAMYHNITREQMRICPTLLRGVEKRSFITCILNPWTAWKSFLHFEIPSLSAYELRQCHERTRKFRQEY